MSLLQGVTRDRRRSVSVSDRPMSIAGCRVSQQLGGDCMLGHDSGESSCSLARCTSRQYEASRGYRHDRLSRVSGSKGVSMVWRLQYGGGAASLWLAVPAPTYVCRETVVTAPSLEALF